MKETMLTMSRKARAPSHGKMAKSTPVSGKMERNTEMECSYPPKVTQSKEDGKMVKLSSKSIFHRHLHKHINPIKISYKYCFRIKLVSD